MSNIKLTKEQIEKNFELDRVKPTIIIQEDIGNYFEEWYAECLEEIFLEYGVSEENLSKPKE